MDRVWSDKSSTGIGRHNQKPKKSQKKKKQANVVLTKSGPSLRSVKTVQMKPGRLWMKGFVEQMIFKSGLPVFSPLVLGD